MNKGNLAQEEQLDSRKREFMKKFGTYAAGTPFAMYMLMSPSDSLAITSGELEQVTSDFNSIGTITKQPGFATDTTAQDQVKTLLDNIYRIFGWSR